MSDRLRRWYFRVNDAMRPYLGPAQLGAGHPEGPDVRSADAPCPICHAPLSQHIVERPAGQRDATRLFCPKAA